MNKPTKRRAALQAAFPHTMPVLAGYLFLGLAYGIYMKVSGFPFLYPMLTAMVIYGGSLEFVCVSMLLSTFAPLQTFLVALMIQARHLFYGLALLDKYKDTGRKQFYLIFTMSDETFAVNSSTPVPDGIDRGWFYFWVSLLDQCYWICGSTLGGILGGFLPFRTEGIDFVMTAMFVVIFLDNFLREKQHLSSFIGVFASLGCLLVFGADSFLIPSMCCILLLLTLFRRPIAQKEGMNDLEDKTE